MRVNGNGTIERRGDSWRIVICLGNDPITGKRRRKTKTVHGSKSEANAIMRKMISDFESGIRIDADSLTFAEYSDEWHQHRKRLQVIRTSSLKYEAWAMDKLRGYIGSACLSEIDPQGVKSIYGLMAMDGLSFDTIRRLHVKLNQCLAAAVDDGLIRKNPCAKVKPPKKKQESKRNSMTVEDAARLMDVLDTSPRTDSRYLAVRIALVTGIRRGEVLGLRWKDVDLPEMSITISQQFTPDGIEKPKTSRGNRRISIDSGTAANIARWKRTQRKLMDDCGKVQDSETPVITDETFSYRDPRNFTRWFADFRSRNGFDDLKFHELRHTQATLLIASGMDLKTVSARLGHASISTTMDLYAHAMPEKDRECSAVISSILSTVPKLPPREADDGHKKTDGKA